MSTVRFCPTQSPARGTGRVQHRGMSFFPPLPEPEPEPEQPRQYPVFPGQPPENWLPGLVPWCLVLARTDDTVVALTQAAAYPQGVALAVTMLQRPGTEDRGYPHWEEGTASI